MCVPVKYIKWLTNRSRLRNISVQMRAGRAWQGRSGRACSHDRQSVPCAAPLFTVPFLVGSCRLRVKLQIFVRADGRTLGSSHYSYLRFPYLRVIVVLHLTLTLRPCHRYIYPVSTHAFVKCISTLWLATYVELR